MDPSAISLIGIGIQLVVGIVAGVWAVGKLSGQIKAISTRIDGMADQRSEDRRWLEAVDKKTNKNDHRITVLEGKTAA